MSTLDDLPQKSISELSTSELHELLRQNRQSRRTPKDTEQAVRATSKLTTKREKARKMESTVAGMTPEQILVLISKLEGTVK